jgi:hypothetical protein
VANAVLDIGIAAVAKFEHNTREQGDRIFAPVFVGAFPALVVHQGTAHKEVAWTNTVGVIALFFASLQAANAEQEEQEKAWQVHVFVFF